jgi:hypothetical protein
LAAPLLVLIFGMSQFSARVFRKSGAYGRH